MHKRVNIPVAIAPRGLEFLFMVQMEGCGRSGITRLTSALENSELAMYAAASTRHHSLGAFSVRDYEV